MRQQIISNHQLLVEQEKNTLKDEITQLDHSIKAKKNVLERRLLLELEKLKHRLYNLPLVHSNIIQALINSVKRSFLS